MPVLLLFALLLFIAKTPAPWYLLLILLGLMYHISFQYMSDCAVFQRRLWLDLYLLPNSAWRSRLTQTQVLRAVAAVAAAVLTIATYLALYAEAFHTVVSITGMIAAADFICRRFYHHLTDNLVSTYAEISRRRLSASVAIAFVLIGLLFTRLYESVSTDYSDETARSIARKTIDDVKHPVIIARHWKRTVRYYDLTLLRIRDTLGWPAGWIVYIAFLIPNAISATGVYSLYRGICIILHSREMS
jgi:hypothetical protein